MTLKNSNENVLGPVFMRSFKVILISKFRRLKLLNLLWSETSNRSFAKHLGTHEFLVNKCLCSKRRYQWLKNYWVSFSTFVTCPYAGGTLASRLCPASFPPTISSWIVATWIFEVFSDLPLAISRILSFKCLQTHNRTSLSSFRLYKIIRWIFNEPNYEN